MPGKSLCLSSIENVDIAFYIIIQEWNTIQYSITFDAFVGVDLDLSVSQGMVVPCNIVGIAMVSAYILPIYYLRISFLTFIFIDFQSMEHVKTKLCIK